MDGESTENASPNSESATDATVTADAGVGRVVRVLPDEAAIDKTFDYLVPDDLGDQVRVGTMVRIALHGRRVGGWVGADGVALQYQ